MAWPKARAYILMAHAARDARVAVGVTIKADGHEPHIGDRVVEVARLRDAFGLAFADALEWLAGLSAERRSITVCSEIEGLCAWLFSPDLPELDPIVAERIRRAITRGSAWNNEWHVLAGRFEPLDVLERLGGGRPIYDAPFAVPLWEARQRARALLAE